MCYSSDNSSDNNSSDSWLLCYSSDNANPPPTLYLWDTVLAIAGQGGGEGGGQG